jgi:hypothetical protein
MLKELRGPGFKGSSENLGPLDPRIPEPFLMMKALHSWKVSLEFIYDISLNIAEVDSFPLRCSP